MRCNVRSRMKRHIRLKNSPRETDHSMHEYPFDLFAMFTRLQISDRVTPISARPIDETISRFFCTSSLAFNTL